MNDIQNRRDIEFLIDAFYTKAVTDDVIGFFFTKVVVLQWEVHIPIMCDFWESVLFGQAKYKGNPMLKHIELSRKHALQSEHFMRWLELWETTVKENFSGEKAIEAISKAKQIGDLMQFKIKSVPGTQ